MRVSFHFPHFVLFLAGMLLCSCGSVKHREMLMLENIRSESMNIYNLPVLRIQPDDILSIQVTSRNPETVIAFLQPQSESQASAGAGPSALSVQPGYRVDEAGFIYLPFLGSVRAANKTVSEFRKEVTDGLMKFIPDASVQVRFLNFRVTILGEVNTPNTYTIPNERLTILEAIGMAGDFTPYARRNSVLVIRQRSNVREFGRIDTRDKSLFESPYFYLDPNDIIYVEPLKAKQYATQGDFFQRYSFIMFPLVTLLTFFLGTKF
ncbi:MAG: polysaccharide export protein [Phaeodactylibacter sp.]|nr:polysaccharide export protein [Phaeodactylibacter sp.]